MREIPVVRQVRGEARRRWFSSTACDLVVWVDADGAAVGFQLCYDKTGHEHALTWKAGLGFSHKKRGPSRPHTASSSRRSCASWQAPSREADGG